MNLDEKYPNISNWIANGCIHIGDCDYYTGNTVSVIDEGEQFGKATKIFQRLMPC